MNLRLFRILITILSFFLLTGFLPILSIVGPSMTALSSGNIYKAGVQFIINQKIEKETGKNSLTLIKETLIKEDKSERIQKSTFDEELRQLVEARIKITRKKIKQQNLQKLVNQRIQITRTVLDINNITQ